MDPSPFGKWIEAPVVRRLAIPFLLLLALYARAPAQTPSAAEELWRRAGSETQADSAAVLLRRLLEEFPQHALAGRARLALADYYYARGDYPLSRVFYQRAARAKENNARALLGEARSHYALGDYSMARNVVRPLLQSDPSALSWSAAFLVALTWEAEGELEEADAVYRRLLTRSPGPAQPAALLSAARVARQLEDGARAADLLLRLRSQYPNSPEIIEADRLEAATEEPGS